MNDRDFERVVYEGQRTHELELDKATVTFQNAVLSPLFLLNGGASVAFLSLLGVSISAASSARLNLGWSLAAVSLWALGLLAGVWAARASYHAQREFTRAVRARRQIFERDVLPKTSPLFDHLTPLPQRSPAEILDAARRLGRQYERLAAGSALLFLAGIGMAAVAVLTGLYRP